MKPALSIRNLVKRYRPGLPGVAACVYGGDWKVRAKPDVSAVNGISFDVAAGECFGLLGPNGAGKSTTINCITGFYPPTSGQVFIDGHDVHREPKAARQRLGVCPQEDTLDTDFNVLDQMIRHGTFFRIPPSEGRRRAIDLCRRFHLEDKLDEPVESLSGGMRRRLQVARAFLSEPRVVVLDEPTTGLDPDARLTLWQALEEYRRQGVAILLSTHYMEEAERLCDRVAILHHGEILACGSPGDLIGRHAGFSAGGGEWKRPPNLEDAFLRLTGRAIE